MGYGTRQMIAIFRYIKIQTKSIDLSRKLWVINLKHSVVTPQNLVLRFLVLSWILIYQNWCTNRSKCGVVSFYALLYWPHTESAFDNIAMHTNDIKFKYLRFITNILTWHNAVRYIAVFCFPSRHFGVTRCLLDSIPASPKHSVTLLRENPNDQRDH